MPHQWVGSSSGSRFGNPVLSLPPLSWALVLTGCTLFPLTASGAGDPVQGPQRTAAASPCAAPASVPAATAPAASAPSAASADSAVDSTERGDKQPDPKAEQAKLANNSGNKAPAQVPPLAELDLPIQCVQIMEEPQSRLAILGQSIREASPARFLEVFNKPGTSVQRTSCDGKSNQSGLVGAGQLTVFVCTKDYDLALASLAADNHSPSTSSSTDNKFNASSNDKPPAPNLILNGFDMGQGAEPLARETLTTGHTSIRYQLAPHQDSEKAWATLYRERGFVNSVFVRPALAWKGFAVFRMSEASAEAQNLRISVTEGSTLILAITLSSLCILLFVWAMYRTDTFRESGTLPLWLEADALRRDLRYTQTRKFHHRLLALRKPEGRHETMAKMVAYTRKLRSSGRPAVTQEIVETQPPAQPPRPMSEGAGNDVPAPGRAQPIQRDGDGNPQEVLPVPDKGRGNDNLQQKAAQQSSTGIVPSEDSPPKLDAGTFEKVKAYYPGAANFKDDDIVDCNSKANRALLGIYPLTDDDLARTVIGLALTNASWKVVRAPFSLSSMQVGVWMVFAVVAAIFLWVVYGALPVLVGSTLGLVAITVVIAGASWIVDPAGKEFFKSQGLFRDLMTGADGQAKVHRFQAVLVNALLLFVGVSWIVKHLTYPTFDDTWLQFLGLSGLAQTVGKTVNEGDKSTK